MATRKKLWHPDIVRQRIRTSQLLNRLQNHALGEKDLITESQRKAIESLLRKTLPDLSSVQVTGSGGGAIELHVSGADGRL